MKTVSSVSLPIPYRPTPWGELLVTAVNATCLWTFTWLQAVTVYFFGIPGWSFHLSAARALSYYEPLNAFRVSLPQLFFWSSLAMAGLCLSFTVKAVRGKPGGIRMIAVVLFFATLSCGFSALVLRWRLLHLEHLEAAVRFFDQSEEEWFEPEEWAQDRQKFQDIIDRHRAELGLE